MRYASEREVVDARSARRRGYEGNVARPVPLFDPVNPYKQVGASPFPGGPPRLFKSFARRRYCATGLTVGYLMPSCSR